MTVHAIHLPAEPFGPVAAGIVRRGTAPLVESDMAYLMQAIGGIDNEDAAVSAWSIGATIGFIAGLSDDVALRDDVQDADNVPFAATYDHATAASRWGLLGNAKTETQAGAFFRACGLMHGWKRGTTDRPDANECGMCEARILTNSFGVDCDHGTFCDEDCRRAVCGFSCSDDGLVG